jgi:hypothetical protein
MGRKPSWPIVRHLECLGSNTKKAAWSAVRDAWTVYVPDTHTLLISADDIGYTLFDLQHEHFVIFNVLTKMRAFWDIVPCSLVRVYRRFGGTYSLHHHSNVGSTLLCNVGLLQRDYTALFQKALIFIKKNPVIPVPQTGERLCSPYGMLAICVGIFKCSKQEEIPYCT